MDLEPLRAIILRERTRLKLTQERAAEAADISKDEWVNLEQRRNTRRTAIRLPQDTRLMNGVAKVIGRETGEDLLREAGLL